MRFMVLRRREVLPEERSIFTSMWKTLARTETIPDTQLHTVTYNKDEDVILSRVVSSIENLHLRLGWGLVTCIGFAGDSSSLVYVTTNNELITVFDLSKQNKPISTKEEYKKAIV